MSTEVRQELAAAASTVEGIACAPYAQPLSQLGQASVRLDRHEYPDQWGVIVHWNVVVGLGQDMAAAEAFFESKAPALVAALRPVMTVRSASLNQTRLTDGTTVLAAFINGFRKE